MKRYLLAILLILPISTAKAEYECQMGLYCLIEYADLWSADEMTDSPSA